MFARKSFWCIDETIKQAGYRTFPYHVYVPSFGEWGFVLASRDDYTPPTTLPDGLRFLAAATLAEPVRLPVGHGARVDASQPSERSGAGAHARIGMARDQPLTATRREFCVASAAALVGLSIKGDRPLAGGFVNDDSRSATALRGRARRRRRDDDGSDAHRHRRRRHRRDCPPRGGCRSAASIDFVLLEMSAQRWRQLALGRERDDGVSVGCALRAGSGRACDAMCASCSRSWAC